MLWHRIGRLASHTQRKIAKMQDRIGKPQGRIERLRRGRRRAHGYQRTGFFALPGMQLLRGLVWAGMWLVERLEAHEKGSIPGNASGPIIEGAPPVPASHPRGFWTFGRRARP